MIVIWKSGILLTSVKWLTDWMTVALKLGIWLTSVKWLTEWLWPGSQEFDWRRWRDCLIEWLWRGSQECDLRRWNDWLIKWLWSESQEFDWRWASDWLIEWLWPESHEFDVCVVTGCGLEVGIWLTSVKWLTDWLKDCGLEVRNLIENRHVIIATKFVPFLGTSQHLIQPVKVLKQMQLEDRLLTFN
jgi:hypothetical protein